MLRTIDAEIINGHTWLVFSPGELGLRLRSRGLVELVANSPTAALALDQIRAGTLRPSRDAPVELRIKLDHASTAVIEIRDAGTSRGERAAAVAVRADGG